MPAQRLLARSYVMLAVIDSGLGMDKETQGRLLSRFSRPRIRQCTGLGLAMVYGSVRQTGEYLCL